MERTTAIILAGGNSQRVSGYPMPKQLIKVHGKYVVSYCLDLYQRMPEVESMVLVINQDFREEFKRVVREGGYQKVRALVPGGTTRQESIYNGIASIFPCDLVMIHNGASILTPEPLIRECLAVAKRYGAASAFVREVYSSFTIEGDRISGTVDRSSLGHVRDPQAFSYRMLIEAHKIARKEGRQFTNDVTLLRAYGHEVYLVESPPDNFKITTDMDIDLAALLLKKKGYA